MGYSITSLTDDYYDGTNCLINKFNKILWLCYDINFSEIDTDELMIATIHSANGITDYLKDIFKNHIIR